MLLGLECPLAELDEILGAQHLTHAGKHRFLLVEEVSLDVEHQRAAALGEPEAVGGQTAHLRQQLVQLLVLAHSMNDGAVTSRFDLGTERREHDLLLSGLVRGELLDDAEEDSTDRRRLVRTFELFDQPFDHAMIALQEVDDIDRIVHQTILSSASLTALIFPCEQRRATVPKVHPPWWRQGPRPLTDLVTIVTIERENDGARLMINDNPMTSTPDHGHEVISNTTLSPDVHRLVVRAPRVAAVRQPGQFVIVRRGPGAERIPLTIADSDAAAGTIVLVVQSVGKSTSDLAALAVGDRITDVVGPLGRPSDLVAQGTAVCVAGGVGAAVIYPIARRIAELGAQVTTVLGARRSESVLFRDEFESFSELIVCTDDGSAGRHGLVTDALRDLLAARSVDVVYAAGPVPMMRAVAAVTEPLGVRTIVSLNPIMVDGTGMCGGCRVTVDGVMRFACVDGPEFEAHGVDFDELSDRLRTYGDAERAASSHECRSAS